MKILSSISLAILSLVLCVTVDSGLEAFFDQSANGKGEIPIVCILLDVLSPTSLTSIIIALLVGAIWWKDAKSRSTSCEIVVIVLSMLLSMALLLALTVTVREYIYLNGSRDISWYRYATNILILISLSYGLWQAIEVDRNSDEKG